VPVNSSHGELVTGDEFTVAFFFTFVTSSPCDEFTINPTNQLSVGAGRRLAEMCDAKFGKG